jgi:hypothetical protein
MKIFINTYKRVGLQHTLKMIPTKYLKDTYLCVHKDEEGQHEHQELVMEEQGKLWVLRDALLTKKYFDDDIIFILDDDLTFARRETPDKGGRLFRLSNREDMEVVFDTMVQWLEEGYAQVGLSNRNGNNRKDGEEEHNTRISCITGLNLKHIGTARYRNPVMEDFDLTLQLLRQGKPNKVLLTHTYDQVGGSNAKGGCSTYRTKEMHEASAHMLLRDHPEFVKVVEKKTKNGWFEGGVRSDVVIQWKKAFKSSKLD